MASYVVLNIDTASPNIQIYAPSYTSLDIINEITVQANEELSLDYYELYAIDANGVRHDYNFTLQTNKFVGYVKFADCPYGILTFYARVMDSVGNKSNLVSKAINLVESITLLTLEVNDKPLMNIDISDKQKNIEISDITRNIEISDRSEKIGS